MAEDVLLMQQEAARRVRRMQEHSRQVFEERQGRTPESLAAARPPKAPPLYAPARGAEAIPHLREEPPRCTQEPVEQHPGTRSDESNAERWLLLGLALLLFRNGCHAELILALLYLAL